MDGEVSLRGEGSPTCGCTWAGIGLVTWSDGGKGRGCDHTPAVASAANITRKRSLSLIVPLPGQELP